MKYAFIAANQDQFKTRPMCRMLQVHPSGFYAWFKEPLSQRAQEDARQTKLVKKAWKDSGKVYGYRKIHDDLIEMDPRTALPAWRGSQAFRLRSVTKRSPVFMVANHLSSLTARWIASSALKHRIALG